MEGEEDGVGQPIAQAGIGTSPVAFKTLATGNGWQRLSVTGTMTDVITGTARTVVDDEMYVVTGPLGIASVPLPNAIRSELNVDMLQSVSDGEIQSADEAVYFVHKVTAEQVAAGTLPTAPETAGVKTFAVCGDYNRTLEKTVSFDKPLSYTRTFAQGGFSGSLQLQGSVKGMATGMVQVRVKRKYCIPYWASLKQIQVTGSLDAQARLISSGSFAQAWSWDDQVYKFEVGSLDTFIGPLWVKVGLNVPVNLGLNASVKATANLDGSVRANGSFDILCHGSDCSTSKSFTHSFTNNSSPSFNLTGTGQVKPWIQGAVRVYLYSDSLAYGQVGVKASLEGNLWGYAGNSCGDADNDGQNETVSALTLDADLGLDLTARVWINSLLDQGWSWALGRWHVGYWDLLPGGSSAAEPIFYYKVPRPGTFQLPGSTPGGPTFKGRMRPCWPYAQTMHYRIDWKDGSQDQFSALPLTYFARTHTWSGSMPARVTLTAVGDDHGRTLNRSTDAVTMMGAMEKPIEEQDLMAP